MLEPGYKSLGTFAITTANTYAGAWVTDLEGLLAAVAQLSLTWGSGGTTIKAFLQTSLDQGETAIDIACVLFGVASEVAILNFSALTPKLTQVTPSDGAMNNDTAVDGIIGDCFRLKLVTTGTYANTVLSGSVVVR